MQYICPFKIKLSFASFLTLASLMTPNGATALKDDFMGTTDFTATSTTQSSPPKRTTAKNTIASLRQRAEEGDTEAVVELGIMFKKGKMEGGRSEENDLEAVRLLREAAGKGNIKAKTELGWMYIKGRVAGGQSIENDREAFRLFNEANLDENTKALRLLARMYDRGRVEDGQVDRRQACNLYKQAKDLGDEKALVELAEAYLLPEMPNPQRADRRGCLAEAYVLLQEARGKNIASASYWLGYMHSMSQEPVAVRIEDDLSGRLRDLKVREYFQEACNRGCKKAYLALANQYYNLSSKDKDNFSQYLSQALLYGLLSKTVSNPLPALELQVVEKLLTFNKKAKETERSFKKCLKSIMYDLGGLLAEFQPKAAMNTSESMFSENEFAIPQLGEIYGFLSRVIGDAWKNLHRLSQATPGFMVTIVSPSVGRPLNLQQVMHEQILPQFFNPVLREMRAIMDPSEADPCFFPHGIQHPLETTLLHYDKIGQSYYLTLGEANIQVLKDFLKFYGTLDQQFDKAEKQLWKLKQIHLGKVNAIQEELLCRREAALTAQKAHRTYLQQRQSGEIISDEETEKMLRETFEQARRNFEEQKKRLEGIPALKASKKEELKEIKQDLLKLYQIRDRLKNLIENTVASRNGDFMKKYPFLRPPAPVGHVPDEPLEQ